MMEAMKACGADSPGKTAMQPLRSFLFAPGNHARRVEKALSLDADAVILDLEDAVATAEKRATRDAVIAALVCAAVDHLDSASDKDLPGSHGIEKAVVGPERNFGLVDLHHALQRLAVGIDHRSSIVAASAPATKPSCT